jgi:hypothetical protein
MMVIFDNASSVEISSIVCQPKIAGYQTCERRRTNTKINTDTIGRNAVLHSIGVIARISE